MGLALAKAAFELFRGAIQQGKVEAKDRPELIGFATTVARAAMEEFPGRLYDKPEQDSIDAAVSTIVAAAAELKDVSDRTGTAFDDRKMADLHGWHAAALYCRWEKIQTPDAIKAVEEQLKKQAGSLERLTRNPGESSGDLDSKTYASLALVKLNLSMIEAMQEWGNYTQTLENAWEDSKTAARLAAKSQHTPDSWSPIAAFQPISLDPLASRLWKDPKVPVGHCLGEAPYWVSVEPPFAPDRPVPIATPHFARIKLLRSQLDTIQASLELAATHNKDAQSLRNHLVERNKQWCDKLAEIVDTIETLPLPLGVRLAILRGVLESVAPGWDTIALFNLHDAVQVRGRDRLTGPQAQRVLGTLLHPSAGVSTTLVETASDRLGMQPMLSSDLYQLLEALIEYRKGDFVAARHSIKAWRTKVRPSATDDDSFEHRLAEAIDALVCAKAGPHLRDEASRICGKLQDRLRGWPPSGFRALNDVANELPEPRLGGGELWEASVIHHLLAEATKVLDETNAEQARSKRAR
jgi:anion-transporting  ArsA/GET3 family ATPase